MTDEELLLTIEIELKTRYILKAQIFWVHLLVLLALLSWLYFCFIEVSILGLVIDQMIGEIESIYKKIAVFISKLL